MTGRTHDRTTVADVVIIGGGIAGGGLATVLSRAGLSVLVLERQRQYRDIVRGETLMPWGVAEAVRLGLLEQLLAGGALTLRWWGLWDEASPLESPPMIDLATNTVKGVDGPMTLSHFRTCAALTDAAAAAGAIVEMGVQSVEMSLNGDTPSVSYQTEDARTDVRCRLIVGASGRGCRVAKRAGMRFQANWHHWGAGLAVEGLSDWPADTHAMGTEGDRMFFVFPQRGGRARLYLNYAPETAERYSGPDRVRRFLDSFQLECLPGSAEIAQARPIGPMAAYPSFWTSTDDDFPPGVVLVGDEAGMCDAILGVGLSNTMRDVRIVSDLLIGNADWTPTLFTDYQRERRERMSRIHASANIMARLFAEFDERAQRRRRVALERMADNPAYATFLLVALNGPEALPDLRFAKILADRLLEPAYA